MMQLRDQIALVLVSLVLIQSCKCLLNAKIDQIELYSVNIGHIRTVSTDFDQFRSISMKKNIKKYRPNH